MSRAQTDKEYRAYLKYREGVSAYLDRLKKDHGPHVIKWIANNANSIMQGYGDNYDESGAPKVTTLLGISADLSPITKSFGVRTINSREMLKPAAQMLLGLKTMRRAIKELDEPSGAATIKCKDESIAAFLRVFQQYYSGKMHYITTVVDPNLQVGVQNSDGRKWKTINISKNLVFFANRIAKAGGSLVVDSQVILNVVRHSSSADYSTWLAHTVKQKRDTGGSWDVSNGIGYVTYSNLDAKISAFSPDPVKSERLCRGRILRSIDKKLMGK